LPWQGLLVGVGYAGCCPVAVSGKKDASWGQAMKQLEEIRC